MVRGDPSLYRVVSRIEPGPYIVFNLLYGLLGVSVTVMIACRALDLNDLAPPLLLDLVP